MKLAPTDHGYPEPLNRFELPPTLVLSAPGLATHGRRVIAIVGSREPRKGARQFTHDLAYHLARAGVIVVSGGAVGIDETAHAGALRGEGPTWLVAPHGRGARIPARNAEIIELVAGDESSRVIWPFADETPIDKLTPRQRNGFLVALADGVVVVQAAYRSGSRNAATWGRRLGKPVFVVPGCPWEFDYLGSTTEILEGGVPVVSTSHLFTKLGLPPPNIDDPRAQLPGAERLSVPLPRARPQTRVQSSVHADRPRFTVDPDAWTTEEKVVFSCLSMAPTQQDTIIDRAGLPTSATLTALLTLSLKDVVVEGPDGFFRCRISI